MYGTSIGTDDRFTIQSIGCLYVPLVRSNKHFKTFTAKKFNVTVELATDILHPMLLGKILIIYHHLQPISV